MSNRGRKRGNVAIAAFTEDQVVRLIGVTKSQLRYWGKDFFTPSVANHSGQQFGRLYSFRDLAALQILHNLRKHHRVSLQHLRQVQPRLAEEGEDWASRTLYVFDRKVVIDDANGAKREAISGQELIDQIPLKAVSRSLRRKINKLFERDQESVGRIEKRRNVMHNKHVIAGTRIPVRSIKAFAEAGYSIEEILKEYPSIERADVEAAIKYRESA